MRTRTLSLFVVAAAALPALGVAARAGDPPPADPLEADAKAKVAYFDKYAGKVKDDAKYGELVMDLTSTSHPVTADRIGKVLNTDFDEEHRLIAAAALGEFKKPVAARDTAGKHLLDALLKDKFTVDVTDSCVDSIGKLQYLPAWEKLSEMLLKGGDPWLLVTCVRAAGRLDDRRLLPALLELWERSPVGYSWETGEVTVDTGTAGDGDQKAAEAAWHAKYGNKVGGKKKPPVMLKAYLQEIIKAVRNITDDQAIEKPSQLRKWMEDRRAELQKLGVDVPRKKIGTKGDEEKGGKGGEKGEGEKGGKEKDGEEPAKGGKSGKGQ